MNSTKQAVALGYKTKNIDGIHYHSFEFGDGYELCLEPLTYGKFYIALYKDGELVTEKVPAKPVVKSED